MADVMLIMYMCNESYFVPRLVFRSTPELGVLAPFVFEGMAPFVPVECGHSSDFVLASPCSPRLPVFLVSPYFS